MLVLVLVLISMSARAIEASTCEPLLAPFLLNLEARVTRVPPWRLDELDEAYLESLAAKTAVDDEDAALRVLNALVDSRLNLLNPLSRRLTRRAIRDVRRPSGLASALLSVAGCYAYYNPICNRVVVPGQDDLLKDPVGAMAYVHEVEHAVQRNSGLRLKLLQIASFARQILAPGRLHEDIVVQRWMEAEAIGAQWEWVNRIPMSIRARWMAELTTIGVVETERDRRRAFVRLELVRSTYHVTFLKELIERALVSIGATLPRDYELYALAVQLLAPSPLVLGRPSDGQIGLLEKGAGRIDREDANLLREILAMGAFGPRMYARLRKSSGPTLGKLDARDGPDLTAAEWAVHALRRAWKDPECPTAARRVLGQLLLRTLENAALSKTEFIDRLSVHHGYDLANLVRLRTRKSMDQTSGRGNGFESTLISSEIRAPRR